jgi:glycosyltransferase involved in cell wall biosynthesis
MRALFINDVGFQYGAGMAHLRQIQSFLLMGWEVAALCWETGSMEGLAPYISPQLSGTWLGIERMPYLREDLGISPEVIEDTLVEKTKRIAPDIIVIGNIHGAAWSPSIVEALRDRLRCPIVVYMHDCYWFTGRCAYTGSCELYKTGCNHTCPTWQEYPSLPPDQIFQAWQTRRDLFCGSNGIPIVTDSNWLLGKLRDGMPNATRTDCLYYGLDEQIFHPMNKVLARKLLGIPQDKFVILGGAINVAEYRKGGHIFQKLFSIFKDDACFLLFGAQSDMYPGAYSTGLLRDYRKLPLVFNAADVFVNTSLEEAFGQTLCEAAACQVPVVAFRVGGVPEIARDGINARLVDEQNELALAKEIEFFKGDRDARLAYGKAGRHVVESEFTLKAQGERWLSYLESVFCPVG